MSDPTPNPEVRYWNPKYRKRKKHQGASWTPERETAISGDGVWCKTCRKIHGYMTLGLDYEKTSKGKWRLVWYCKRYGRVVREQDLAK